MELNEHARRTGWLLSAVLLLGAGATFARVDSESGPAARGGGAAPTPMADYQFAGDLGSSVAGAPDLTETGSGSLFGSAVVDGVVRPSRGFDAGNGLRLAGADALISDNVYSIQMTVFLRDLTGGGTNFVKLLDFGDLGDDFGLYAVNNGGSPTITFFDSAGQPFGVAGAFPEQDWVQVVATRDSNNTITVYLDGIQQFTHAAAAADTDVAGPLVFLDDDSATGGSEISSGAIACVRIYPTALDPATVATLDCAPLMRVGINGQACAFTTIGSAVLAAQSGDDIHIEAGTYKERIGAVVNKDLQLLAAQVGSNCMQAEPFPGAHVVIDGNRSSGLTGVGGILDLVSSNVSLTQIDLTNGSSGQGGLVSVRQEGSLLTFGSSFSNGTASADLVSVGIVVLDTDEPAGGCIYAENASLDFQETTFSNCRVIGPNNGADPVNGDGGAIHARLGSTVELDFAAATDNSARNGGAIALVDAMGFFSNMDFSNNTAANFGGAIAATDAPVQLGFNSTFAANTAGDRGGALDMERGSLEISDRAVFENNSSARVGGAIAVSGADLAIRPSSDAALPTRFSGNSALSGGAIIIRGSTTGALANPTIEKVAFDGNNAGVFGGAITLEGTSDVEIVDTTFSNNAAGTLGGAISSVFSSSIIRSSSACKAFGFADPDRYCSEFRNNIASQGGSAIQYSLEDNSTVETTAFVGNSAPHAVLLSLGGAPDVGNAPSVAMESVWMFDNQGDAVMAVSRSVFQVTHGTFHNNAGSAYVGLEASALFMFNSIAFGNDGGGVSSLGTGPTAVSCNFDQSNLAGPNIDPLLVTNADGQSHLDPASPAIDVCPDFAQLPVDLDGRDRVFGPAPDAGAFEANDILFVNGFE